MLKMSSLHTFRARATRIRKPFVSIVLTGCSYNGQTYRQTYRHTDKLEGVDYCFGGEKKSTFEGNMINGQFKRRPTYFHTENPKKGKKRINLCKKKEVRAVVFCVVVFFAILAQIPSNFGIAAEGSRIRGVRVLFLGLWTSIFIKKSKK